MDTFFIVIGILMFAMVLVILYRVAFGPTTIDRMVAVNIIGTKTTVLLIVIGTIFKRVDMFVDFALTYSLLNFVGSLAAAKFFLRHKTVDPEKPKTEAGGAS